jgi:hypothetical protein
LAVTLSVVLGLAFWAVETVAPPNDCASAAEGTQIQSGQEPAESFRCPSGWAPITWFTGCLVVVGGLQGIFFVWQLILIRQGLADTAKAADAAERSSSAASASLVLATRTAERQLRAYVLITGGIYVVRSLDDLGRGHIEVKNTGQTPAYNMTMWSNIFVERHPLGADLPQPDPALPMTSSILAPGCTTSMFTGNPTIQAPYIWARVGTPDCTIYVYGEINYTDAFAVRRVTKFRLIYGGPEGPQPDGKMSFDLDGNEAT